MKSTSVLTKSFPVRQSLLHVTLPTPPRDVLAVFLLFASHAPSHSPAIPTPLYAPGAGLQRLRPRSLPFGCGSIHPIGRTSGTWEGRKSKAWGAGTWLTTSSLGTKQSDLQGYLPISME